MELLNISFFWDDLVIEQGAVVWREILQLLESSFLLAFLIVDHILEELLFIFVGSTIRGNLIDFFVSHWLNLFIFRSWLSSSFSNRCSELSSTSSDIVGCSTSFSSNSLSFVEWNCATNSNDNENNNQSSTSSPESLFNCNFSITNSEKSFIRGNRFE